MDLSSFLNLKISVLSRSAAEKLSVTESCSSGEICFRRFKAQATQIGVKTLKSAAYIRTYAYGLCISQFQLRPPPPPPPGQLRGICTHCQSRGSGIRLPKGYPRAFDTLVVSDSKSKRRRFYRKRPVVCH